MINIVPSRSPRVHVGVNVYFWGSTEQNRLLVECLGPAAHALRQSGACGWFWYDRFDARGPHVFAIFSVPADARDHVARDLARRIEAYLAAQPSTESLSTEVLATRHTECRGKQLCAIDGEPGLAANNTYRLFDHPARAYPFVLTEGMAAAREEALWSLVDELASWALAQIAPAPARLPTVAALRWLAGLDHTLQRSGLGAEAYWRYHATTLIYGLAERLAASEAEALRSLHTSISDKNRQSLSTVWQHAAASVWTPLPALVDLIACEPDWPMEDRWRLLRKLVHTALKQLGLPVAQHIPVVLFAWQRNLPPIAAS